MKPTLRFFLFGLCGWIIQLANAQTDHKLAYLLKDSATLAKARHLTHHMYNWQFDSARYWHRQALAGYENHPANTFTQAMILYWENYPTRDRTPSLQQQEALLRKTIELAEKRLALEPQDLEGAFFKMVAKGILVRYFSDFGRYMDGLQEAKDIYPLMLRALDNTDQFVEYKVPAGLYKYYREYYPEVEAPSLKPFVMFFRPGSRAEGVALLRQAVNQATFTRPEALYYMGYILTWYEQQPDSALAYNQLLHQTYPKNDMFTMLLAENQLMLRNLPAVADLAQKLTNSPKSYFQTAGRVFGALVLSSESQKQYDQAMALALQAEQQVERDPANWQGSRPLIYYVMSVCAQAKGDEKEAKANMRKARKADQDGLLKVYQLE